MMFHKLRTKLDLLFKIRSVRTYCGLKMTVPVNLAEVSVEEFKCFISTFDHVFSDCDGVIWEQEPYPGIGRFFELIEMMGKTVNFISNNSIRCEKNYNSMFDKANIKNGFKRLTIPSTAIAEYLKSVNFEKHVFCITCEETVRTLRKNGIKCKEGPVNGFDSMQEYRQCLEEDPEIGAVVIDSDFKINLPKIQMAITYLQNPDVLFITGATDRYVPFNKNRLALSIGPFTDIVKMETRRQPHVLGKPNMDFGIFAMKQANLTNFNRVLIIGDMIEQDMGLGKALGFTTLLVLTNAKQEDITRHHELTPDYCIQKLTDLVPIMEEVVKDF